MWEFISGLLSSNPLIFMSILIPVTHCLDDLQLFLESAEIMKYESFITRLLTILGTMNSCMNFKINSSISEKNSAGIFR